jgi:tRNA modification GTPase
LFNALLGRTRALVDPRPGTTRDVVEARCVLGPLTATLLDTAGERAATDPVEAAGLALARGFVEEADLLLVVVRAAPDAPDAVERDLLARTADRRRIVVYNGIDRSPVAPAREGWWPTSAVTGEGIPALVTAIASLAGGAAGEGLLVASARQRDRLLAVEGACNEALEAFSEAGIAAAADAVVRGIEELDALTGADTREDVLDAVFARFCIGK